MLNNFNTLFFGSLFWFQETKTTLSSHMSQLLRTWRRTKISWVRPCVKLNIQWRRSIHLQLLWQQYSTAYYAIGRIVSKQALKTADWLNRRPCWDYVNCKQKQTKKNNGISTTESLFKHQTYVYHNDLRGFCILKINNIVVLIFLNSMKQVPVF